MHILVIGASGRVGQQLVKKLLQQDHQVTGSSRQEYRLFDSPRYQQVNIDLTADQSVMKQNFPDKLDAIYFTSGSRGKNLLQVELHGAIKTMQIAEQKGIKRYIMLSTQLSFNPELWTKEPYNELLDFFVAKHYADTWLRDNTALDYTILQPGALKEKSGSGRISLDPLAKGENSIENVADTLAGILGSNATIHQIITMQDGETPIKEALSNF